MQLLCWTLLGKEGEAKGAWAHNSVRAEQKGIWEGAERIRLGVCCCGTGGGLVLGFVREGGGGSGRAFSATARRVDIFEGRRRRTCSGDSLGGRKATKGSKKISLVGAIENENQDERPRDAGNKKNFLGANRVAATGKRITSSFGCRGRRGERAKEERGEVVND